MKFCSAGRHDGAAGAGRRGDHIVSPPTHSPAVELCSGGMGGNPWGESHIFPHTMDTLWTQTQILGKGSGPWPPTKLFSFFLTNLSGPLTYIKLFTCVLEFALVPFYPFPNSCERRRTRIVIKTKQNLVMTRIYILNI